MLSIEETNYLLRYTSNVFDKLFIDRFLIESKLFPVSEYILVSCVNSYEKFYYQLKKLSERISAKEIAERERGKIFTEITPLQIFNIHMFPLFGRTIRISNLYLDDPMKEPEEKFDQIRFIMTFWKELASTYYNGYLTVDEMDEKCQIASDESLEIIISNMKEVEDYEKVSTFKKITAKLEQLAFLDECETRMKISNHGPYHVNENESIIVKEIVRLYDGKTAQWPWSETKAEAPYSNILIAYQIKQDVKCRYNDWGTLKTEPHNFKKHIVKYCFLSKRGDTIISLDQDELNAFEEYAQGAHKELYLKYSKWNKEQRLKAGILVYNKNFDRFTNLVDITDKIDWGITENVQKNELKRFLENKVGDFSVGNWVARSRRKRKVMPTYFERREVDLKEIGSFYK
ncbi:MAG: hypothetical protein EU549_03400 [Promethearchaeota archaeon]|nr:MAG: hypothetical protein EU549_03400 [Candidatus Lokiarchaeota archaeon]